MRLILFLCVLLFPGAAAHAEWLQSSSAHFVVYANDSERNIRLFSEQLEHYDAAMAVITGIQVAPPSPSNRVTVYVVRDIDQVQRLLGDKSGRIGGFYIPRAGGSLAIIPRVSASVGVEFDQSMLILLHEYAHHFLISQGGFPLPRWMSEGGAEFFAQATFDADGAVGLGRPANARLNEMHMLEDFDEDIVNVEELVDPALYEKRKNKDSDAFYAKSWALYHYLVFGAQRKGQLSRYVTLMTQGKKSAEAARDAFGNLAALEREVSAYASKGSMTAAKLPGNMLHIGSVEVRKLSVGEADMMPIRIRSRRGVNKAQAAELLPEARAVASRYPLDPYVLSALAEAEYDAGNDAETVAAAGKALKIDTMQVNAYYQLGLALLRIADKATDKGVTYDTARTPFLLLNRLERDNPLPLIYYFQSFVRQGIEPPPDALQGLERAAFLAPFDMGLRLSLALQEIKHKQRDLARSNLLPVAYSPHGGAFAEAAQKMLAQMESDPDWDASGARDPLTEQSKAQ